MRNPIFATLTICSMLLAACGRMDFETKKATMSEADAFDTLMEVELEEGGRNLRGRRSGLSAQALIALIQELIASGKLKIPSEARSAATGGVDLSTLNSIFALLQSGQATNIGSLAQGLLNLNGGSTGATGSKISGLMSLLTTLAPLIATFAPQFAPIIAAVTTILPMVMNIFGLFRRPRASTSAAILRFATIV